MGSTVLAGLAATSTPLYTVPFVGIELGTPAFTAIGIVMITFLIMGSGFF